MTIDLYPPGATGDMYYKSSSGLLVPVSLATGQVPQKQSDGTILGTSISGGSALPVWSPHKAPASANALDVEFASSSTISAWPAGWAVSGGGDFPNAVFPNAEPGRFSTTNAVAGWKGRVATVPAGDFNLAAYVAMQGPNANFSMLSLGLQGSSTIGGTGWTMFYAGYHGTFGGFTLAVEQSTGAVPKSWGSNYISTVGVVIYIRRVSGTAFFGWSIDGLTGPESSGTAVSGHTHISVGAYNSQGGVGVIRWVRAITTSGARQNWGGLL